MRKDIKYLFLLFILTAGLIFALDKVPTVVTSINPYYLIAKEIAGNRLNIQLLIKPGSDPHTFSPSISDVKVLSNASLIIANGLCLDNSYLKNYKNVVYLGEFIPKDKLLEGSEGDGSDIGNSHEVGYNPHVWLAPDFLIDYIIPKIVQEISKLDSKNKSYYENNAKKVITSLKIVSKNLDKLLANQKGSVVILEHPSFMYLFNKYGIEVLSVEEGHGKEPSTSHIKEIIKKAKSKKLLGIFVGPQFNESSIKTVANELKTEYMILDPLGFKIKAQKISELFNEVYRVLQSAISKKSGK